MTHRSGIAVMTAVVLAAGGAALTGAPAARAGAESKELVELGRRLFMDPTASRLGIHSCASCHDPEKAFSDPRPQSPDDRGPTRRHSQSLLDLAGAGFHWDGEFESVRQLLVARVAPLEAAAKQATDLSQKRRESARSLGRDFVVDESESMDCRRRSRGYGTSTDDGDTPPEAAAASTMSVAERLTEDRRYANAFRDAFGDDEVTTDRVLDAMDAYCASIRSTTNAYDRFVAGDAQALSEQERRGLALFEGKANCAQCHLTKPADGRAPFSDAAFHDTGVAARAVSKDPKAARNAQVDLGRSGVTLLRKDVGAFKTPTLRDVAARGPYMHDASFATLTDVVKYYAAGGTPHAGLDPAIHRLDLSDGEVADVVAFLGSLAGARRAALGFPSATAKPLRVRVETLAGKPVAGLEIFVAPFGDRLEGADDVETASRVVADKDGAAVIHRPLWTHVLLTSRRYRLGLSRPIPDSAESQTLVATPIDTVSLRLRRTSTGPTFPESVKVYADGATTTAEDGSPTKPTLTLKLVRQPSSREAVYAAKGFPSAVDKVTLVMGRRTLPHCKLALAGDAGETVLLDGVPVDR